ncbi:MAG TPA: TolC family protein [Chitinispirillaceae bacterium]|nr:TolC family protein [Chitinispirillaceae bacterium]
MKNWFLITILIFFEASLSTAPPSAAAESVTFANARELILSRNSGLKSTITDIDAAKAGIGQAGVLPNPDISVSLDKFGANEIEATVEQRIELGDKRKLRTGAAQKEIEKAINVSQVSKVELESEIVRRFIPIAITTNMLEAVDSILKISEVTRDQIQKRVDAGGSRMTDLVRIEIDIEQLKLERSELLNKNKQARLKFAALGSEQDTALVNVTGDLDEIPLPDIGILKKSVESNPVYKSFAIDQSLLETQRRQLHADAIPDLNLSAGYLRSNTDHYNSPLVGLSMTIPVFNKNTAAQKQLELKWKAVGEQQVNVQRLLTADIEDIHSQIVIIDRKLQALMSSTIPKAQQVYVMLQEYYNAGNAGFLDLAEAQAEMLRLKLEIIEMQQERALRLADLMQITATNIQFIK